MRKEKNKNRAKSNAQGGKKKYSTPEVVEYGTVREFTHLVTGTSGSDGGTAPANRAHSCIAPAPVVEEHRILIGDNRLQNLYREAIFAAVKPGDVVLDLGTGSGLHAFFACQAGAKKVYAIESGDILEIARNAARKNGFEDRIEFVFGFSNQIELPEKVDVIISNIGYMGSLQSLPDAAKRFLKKDGRMVPSMVKNSFVPIEMPKFYDEKIGFWNEKHYGLDFSTFSPYAINRPHANHCTPEHFLAKPEDLAGFDFMKPLKSNYRWDLNYKATRSGMVHGFLGWYGFRLHEDIWLSTKPPLALSPVVWKQPFLPCEKPFEVKAGDKIQVRMEMHMKGSSEEPIWSWKVQTEDISMEQTSFNAMPLSKEILEKIAKTRQ